MSSLDVLHRLTAALNEHLADYPLPAPIDVDLDLLTGTITMQVEQGRARTRLTHLAAWAHSLHPATITGHRSGEDLHLSVAGRISGGIAVRVYGSVSYAGVSGLISVGVGDTAEITVADLTRWLIRPYLSAGAP